MITVLFLITALAASAAEAPAPTEDLSAIHDQFIEAVDGAQKQAALEKLARTPPATLRELKALFDVFMRFPEKSVRESALASLRRIEGDRGNLEAGLIEYLKLPESEAQVFAMTGLLRLKSPRALPLITAVAQRRFKSKSPGEAALMSDRNEWWAVDEALATLAQWEGAKARPLLRSKTG
ncbi:MAG: hypothetical protein PHF00_08100, partial [Elusimicrobia bacterium]|nr:hypothetical protein [Elusimicrobiota bacterium]